MRGRWVKQEEREYLPRHRRGCDYGRDCPVLLRMGDFVFFQIPGHNDWICRGSSGYYATRFCVEFPVQESYRRFRYDRTVDIHEGRLTNAHLYEVRKKVAQEFKIDFETLPIFRSNETWVYVS